MGYKKYVISNIIILLVTILSLPAFAVPTISSINNSFTNGNSITIQGAGFGSHANFNAYNTNYLNAGWKDFEDRQLEGSGFQLAFDEAFSANWSILSGGKANSGSYARMSYQVSERGPIRFPQQNNANGEWYISFWFMMPPNCQSGKFFRIYGASPAENIYLSSGCSDYYIRGFSECTSCGTLKTQWSSPNSFQNNTWHRVEIWMGQNPSTFSVWMDGKLQWTKSDWVYNPFGNGYGIDFGNMIDNAARGCSTAGSYNFDDLFIDYTRARVEIGNSATWAGCTKREIQLPVAWNNNTITFRANQGVFSTGETVYLYVVDAAGVSNVNGYPITISGSNRETTPPAVPSGVNAVTLP